MNRTFLFLVCMFTTMSLHAQKSIPLYEGKIPNSKPAPDEEKMEKDPSGLTIIVKISTPTLSIYLPPAGTATGTAVIICPGGGYAVNAFIHEGTDVAAKFLEMGVAAFVLKYRIPNDVTMINREIGPLQDVQQAIRVVRNRSKEWGINPDRVGVMGFSAGGHLASTAGTHYEHPVIENAENINLRPDFMMLIYPVISFQTTFGHLGSRDHLIGQNATAEKVNFYSNELQVTPRTPPTFLVHASDDDGVKPENSIAFYQHLIDNKVLAELHIYEHGGHGFGLVNKTTDDLWMERAKSWMKSNGWFKK